jgi:branched-chain amino acid transport system substrate-binding protein
VPVAASGTPIRVGWINIQGGASSSQPNTTVGARAAAAYVNGELGGIEHRPIQLVECFTDTTAESSLKCANQMVQSRVIAVLLGQDSNSGDIARVVTQAGLPYIAYTGNSTQELTLPGAFSLTGGTGAQIAALATYSKQKSYKKVAIVTLDSPAAIAVTQTLGGLVFKNAGVGLQVIRVARGTADMTPQVQAARDGGADAVGVVGTGTFCTTFLNAASAVAPGLPLEGVAPCAATSVTSVSPPDAVARFVIPQLFRLDGDDATLTEYRRVISKYGSKDVLGDPLTVYGYGVILALHGFLQNLTGDLAPTNIISAIKTTPNVPLPLAPGLTMTCDGSLIKSLPNVCSVGAFVYGFKANGTPNFLFQTDTKTLFATP